MVKIRLKRIGATKRPKYRVVVQDSRTRRDGAVIEEIGFYDPQANPVELRIDAEKAKKWLSNGAQPTETALSLLRKADVVPAAAKK
ncbi:MAG: 30S ribosomal protein S16 [Candidatus Sericytochromatia bacterium]|nr:30S ribosomal protein S16 [Candidatus Sericytochromatia bacterium]